MTVSVPAMSGAELQSMREFLGLSTKWLADYLDVGGERKVMRWEDEELAIPDAITGLVDDLYQEADALVGWLVAEYRWRVALANTGVYQGVYLTTYRTDRDFQRALTRWGVRGQAYPSRWHRMLCARVVDQVPGVVLVYA